MMGEFTFSKTINQKIIKNKLKMNRYKLNYAGYDFLALKALNLRGTVSAVGSQIGVGKESDIYVASNMEGKEMVIKIHRLGRTSFRTVKNNRDYLRHRKNANWLYLSRLAALKEFAYLKALHKNGFPVPTPHDYNRHLIVMERIIGYPLCQIASLNDVGKVYEVLMSLIVRFAKCGLIHGDFNEFNILIDENEKVTIIDLPQMVSTEHLNAKMYFERDVECIRIFFERRFNFSSPFVPQFEEIGEKEFCMDEELQASGFDNNTKKEFESILLKHQKEEENKGGEENGEEQNNQSGEEENDQSGEEDNQSGEEENEEIKIEENKIDFKKEKKKVSFEEKKIEEFLISDNLPILKVNPTLEKDEKTEKEEQSEEDEEGEEGKEGELKEVKSKKENFIDYSEIKKKAKREVEKKLRNKRIKNEGKQKKKKDLKRIIKNDK